jgi:hypothetical protein
MTMLYIIGKGSIHYNEELKFSLRSVERVCPEIKRLIVAGEPVQFLSDKVEFIPIAEAVGNKEYCIAQKVLKACEFIKGDFIFMNDDFFFTRKQDWSLNYAKPELKALSKFGRIEHYQKAIDDTKKYLQSLGYSTYHFDVHTPIVYNSEKFKALAPHFEKSKLSSNGFVVKSLYGNIYGLEPCFYEDVKLNRMESTDDYRMAKETHCISCSDGSWHQGVRAYLLKMFPNKSKYEK